MRRGRFLPFKNRLADRASIRVVRSGSDLHNRGTMDAKGLPLAPDTHQFIAAASKEASRLGHEYFGTEHLAFALARPAHAATGSMLRRLGVDLDSVQRALEATVLPGSAVLAPDVQRPSTSRTMQVLDFAEQFARDLGCPAVGVEHLVLGMLQERMNVGAQVLTHHGLTLEAVRAEVGRVSDGGAPGTSPQ